MQRIYEGCFLIKADLSDEDIGTETAQIEETVTKNGGVIARKDLWARRTLTFPIKKKSEAVYFFVYFTAESSAIAAIEPVFRTRENVLRFHILTRKAMPAAEPPPVATEGDHVQPQSQ